MFETFNRHGWYWGAAFSGDSVDSMHFEWSEESVGAGDGWSLQAVGEAPGALAFGPRPLTAHLKARG